MGFFDTVSDLVEAVVPWSNAHAEAAPEKAQDNEDSKTEDKSEEGEDSESKDEPEEEEEEEMVDPKDKLEEECKESSACSPVKHHYEECVERVTGADEGDKKHPGEDCVEEFFHLAHCATQCAAPKLWAALK